MVVDVAGAKTCRHVAAYVHATWRMRTHVRACGSCGIFYLFLGPGNVTKCRACDHVNHIAIGDLYLSEGVRSTLLLDDYSYLKRLNLSCLSKELQ